MKKWFSKIKLILAMTLMVGLLTACNAGSTVETKLTINNDLSGSRVMELVINESVFSEYFTGTIEQLNAALTETCPAQLTWAYDDSTGSKIYRFTLNFSNPQDYKTKVDALIGEGSDVEIEITQADSVWASGVLVNESFSSGQLLGWLQTMLVEKGFVDSSNTSKIFQEGSCTVLYRGEEYSDSGSIYIDRIEYLDIDKIELLTDVNGYDSYNKTIVLTIPKSAMEKKGDEIKAWLAERVPEGANAEWKEDQNGKFIYTVSKKEMSATELETFLKTYFDTDNCSVEQIKLTDNVSPFAFRNSLQEIIDFSSYVLSNRINYTDIYAYVVGANGYGAGRDINDLADGTVSEDDYSEYPGYKKLSTNKLDNTVRQFDTISQKVYRVSEVNVTSAVGLFGGLSREYTFVLDKEPSEAEKEEILAKINAKNADYAELKEASTAVESTEMEPAEAETEVGEAASAEWKVKVSAKLNDDDYTVTIKLEGDAEEMDFASRALFGGSGSLVVTKDFNFATLNYPVAVYDTYTLGHFVDYCTENVDCTYTLNTGFGCKVEYVNNDEADEDGAKVVIEDASVMHGLTVITYGSQFNVWAIGFYFLVLCGVVCIVIALKKAGVFDGLLKRPAKKAEPKEEVQVVNEVESTTKVESTDEVQTTSDAPKFCNACGAPRQNGARVCTQCGTRFEK